MPFLVQEYSDDGELLETHGPGTRQQAVACLLRLADEHGVILTAEEKYNLRHGGEDEFSSDDSWEWRIVKLDFIPFPKPKKRKRTCQPLTNSSTTPKPAPKPT